MIRWYRIEVIEVGKAPLRGNDMKVVRILRGYAEEPTLTDDQEDIIIADWLRAYENGDIPQEYHKEYS